MDWIVAKRDGHTHPRATIEALVRGLMQGSVADYQMTAWLMAATLRGLDLRETVALTHAMLHSGDRLQHVRLGSPTVDKHSTGGVGDKISLCLAPLAAACGLHVPMISGRGLGHTGGTLDKLESIAGYETHLSIPRFKKIVRDVGASIIGQTESLAPADRRIYALRDVSGSVESESLICASILSKKLAAGLDGLVLDVKVGRGAFMKQPRTARRLARLLVRVGGELGLRVSALLTDMSSPIGRSIGNALEAAEAIEVARGEGPADTRRLTIELVVEMLRHAEPEGEEVERRARVEQALSSGAAAERLERMIAAHGGDARVVNDPGRLPKSRYRRTVAAPLAGRLESFDALQLGHLALALGAGRTRADLPVDPAAGIELLVSPGETLAAGQPTLRLHGPSPSALKAAAAQAQATILYGSKRVRRSRVLERISADSRTD